MDWTFLVIGVWNAAPARACHTLLFTTTFFCPTNSPTEGFIGKLPSQPGGFRGLPADPSHHCAIRGLRKETSIVSALSEIGRRLVDTLLPLG